MRRKFKTAVIGAITIAILSVSGVAMAAEVPYGASGASEDNNYMLTEMLTYALQDEYLAQAEYTAIMDQYGTIRPFTNIAKAESSHINALTQLFKEHGVSIADNDAQSRVVVPASLSDAFSAGVEVETTNISMYASFLKEDLPSDVRDVFENLSSASQNHLRAFKNAADGQTADGGGNQNTSGNGASATNSNSTGCTQSNNGSACTGDCTQSNSSDAQSEKRVSNNYKNYSYCE